MEFLARYRAKAPARGRRSAGRVPAALGLCPDAGHAAGDRGDRQHRRCQAGRLSSAATNSSTVIGDVAFGKDGEWAAPRMIVTQFQNIKGNSLEQFKDPNSEVVLLPADLRSGTLISPYRSTRPVNISFIPKCAYFSAGQGPTKLTCMNNRGKRQNPAACGGSHERGVDGRLSRGGQSSPAAPWGGLAGAVAARADAVRFTRKCGVSTRNGRRQRNGRAGVSPAAGQDHPWRLIGRCEPAASSRCRSRHPLPPWRTSTPSMDGVHAFHG